MASIDTLSTRVIEARARLARATKYKGRTAPETIEARRDLAAALIEKRVREVVDAAPPLTADQKAVISRALSSTSAKLGEESSVPPSFRKGTSTELTSTQPATEVAG